MVRQGCRGAIMTHPRDPRVALHAAQVRPQRVRCSGLDPCHDP